MISNDTLEAKWEWWALWGETRMDAVSTRFQFSCQGRVPALRWHSFRVRRPYDRLLQNADVRNTSQSDCIEWLNRATQVKLMVNWVIANLKLRRIGRILSDHQLWWGLSVCVSVIAVCLLVFVPVVSVVVFHLTGSCKLKVDSTCWLTRGLYAE